MALRCGNQARTTKPGEPGERRQLEPVLAFAAAIPAAAGAWAEEREFPLLTEGQGKPRKEELLVRSWDASKLNKSAPSPSEMHGWFLPPRPSHSPFPSIRRHPGEGCSEAGFERRGNRGMGQEGCTGANPPGSGRASHPAARHSLRPAGSAAARSTKSLPRSPERRAGAGAFQNTLPPALFHQAGDHVHHTEASTFQGL